jgi:hypothetical protein
MADFELAHAANGIRQCLSTPDFSRHSLAAAGARTAISVSEVKRMQCANGALNVGVPTLQRAELLRHGVTQ